MNKHEHISHGRLQFSIRRPTESSPSTDHQKIGTVDYVGDPYGFAKFGANPRTRGF